MGVKGDGGKVKGERRRGHRKPHTIRDKYGDAKFREGIDEQVHLRRSKRRRSSKPRWC